MKSCLGSLLLFIALVALLATGGGIWYLSKTAKFSRKDKPAETPAVAVPTANPSAQQK